MPPSSFLSFSRDRIPLEFPGEREEWNAPVIRDPVVGAYRSVLNLVWGSVQLAGGDRLSGYT